MLEPPPPPPPPLRSNIAVLIGCEIWLHHFWDTVNHLNISWLFSQLIFGVMPNWTGTHVDPAKAPTTVAGAIIISCS